MKKFEFIYEDLKRKIEDGEFPIGSFLPKENDLARKYEVSRETLRKAQGLLQEQGIIQKIHGRGAKVLDVSKFEISTKGITSFSKLLSRHKGKLTTKILQNKLTYLKPGTFGYQEVGEAPVISVERLRLLKNEGVIFDKDYFLTEEVGKEIPEAALQHSVYDYLENVQGLKIGYAQKDITIEEPPADIRLALDIAGDTHVVLTRSLVYLDNTHLFQVHEAYQRVDTFHLSDIARR
jgi:GntR family trehalose operon transcriptional repressor